MVLEYVTIDSIISRMSIGNSVKIPLGDIIEYTGQVMDGISSPALIDTSVIFLAISNHKGVLPPGIIDIEQVAKYRYTGSLKSLLNPKSAQDIINSENICPKKIYQEVSEATTESKPTCCSCKEPVLKVETIPLAIRYFEIGSMIHDIWFCTPTYKSNFIPMSRTTNTMFNVLECADSTDIDVKFQDYQYSIKAPLIICSFKEGIVAMAVKRLKLDEKGFPLIPKDEYLERAIANYCKWQYYSNMLESSFTNQYKYLAEMNKAEYQTNYSYALSNFKTKGLIDTLENLYKHNNSLIPKNYTYSNFFSNFATYYER